MLQITLGLGEIKSSRVQPGRLCPFHYTLHIVGTQRGLAACSSLLLPQAASSGTCITGSHLERQAPVVQGYLLQGIGQSTLTVSVIYCCVTNDPQTINIYDITCAERQESGSSLAGWFWLRVSHEAAAGQRPKWDCRICFQTHSLGCGQASVHHWLLAGDFSSLRCRPLHGDAHVMAAGFP